MIKSKILCIVMILFALTGCGYPHYEDYKPNDDISEELYDAMDGEVRYFGNGRNNENVLEYNFYIDGDALTKENISLFVNTAISVLLEDNDKVSVYLDTWIPDGIGGMCYVSNFYQCQDGMYQTYSNLCVYSILWLDLGAPKVLDPDLFTGAEGIRYLRFSNKMNEKAKELGIDWYEIWPDHEGIEVIPTPGYDNCISS